MRFRESKIKTFLGEHAPRPTWTVLAPSALGPPNLKHLPTALYIHYKTQTGSSCEKCKSKAFQLGIEPVSSGLLDQCSTTELQKLLLTTWARVQYIY